MAKKENIESFADAIGSSETIPLSHKRGGGPLDWMSLARTIQDHLESTGGRPTNPNWDFKRQVPFRKDVWKLITTKANSMSQEGRKVGPAQLSAFLIEEALLGSGLIEEENPVSLNSPKTMSDEAPEIINNPNQLTISMESIPLPQDTWQEPEPEPAISPSGPVIRITGEFRKV